MARLRILVTNDDGWDAPGLAALKSLAAEIGDVFVVAPRDPHSYAGHRVTTDVALHLLETAPQQFHLSGTPADCVRVALTSLIPEVDWILSGINRGGNLGADIFTSGTVAAAREAALLGKPAIAISQYLRRGLPFDWKNAAEMALPVIQQLVQQPCPAKGYFNVNLPHLTEGDVATMVTCDPDNEPLDVRFEREGQQFRFSGAYSTRTKTPGRDVHHCFSGAITISRLSL